MHSMGVDRSSKVAYTSIECSIVNHDTCYNFQLCDTRNTMEDSCEQGGEIMNVVTRTARTAKCQWMMLEFHREHAH